MTMTEQSSIDSRPVDLRDDAYWEKADAEGTARTQLATAQMQAATTIQLTHVREAEIESLLRLGEMSQADFDSEKVDLLSRRRRAVKFQHLVDARRAQLKSKNYKQVMSEIYRHRASTLHDNFEPTPFDERLWGMLEQMGNSPE